MTFHLTNYGCSYQSNYLSIRYCHQGDKLNASPSPSIKNPSLKDFIKSSSNNTPAEMPKSCGDKVDDDDLIEEEEMFAQGPFEGTMEWNGPTRGGRRPEPTRYGDWERKGRVSDF